MDMHPKLCTVSFISILFLITSALANGIKNGNLLGILLALGSLVALGFCIHFARKLAQTAVGEDQEAEPGV